MITGQNTRAEWLQYIEVIALPVLESFSQRKFCSSVIIETPVPLRACFVPLEALARVLSGIAPFLAGAGGDTREVELREKLQKLSCLAIAAIVDPESPDYGLFTDNSEKCIRKISAQPLVDAAILCQAILRAPNILWEKLEENTKEHLRKAMLTARMIRPYHSNWLLFSAMVEVGLDIMGVEPDLTHVDYAIGMHDTWYRGDGCYSDGKDFAFDYYNSLIIQPMLIEVSTHFAKYFDNDEDGYSEKFIPVYITRAKRYTEYMERLVSGDGSFPIVGRSMTYRCGAFHLPAFMALTERLPENCSYGQMRRLLRLVISRTLSAKDTTNAGGWLNIGLVGSQPSLGEFYINTGSIYFCLTAFLPLGLSSTHDFWTQPEESLTWEKVWSGEDVVADMALEMR